MEATIFLVALLHKAVEMICFAINSFSASVMR